MITTVYLVRHGETDWNREGKLQGREDIELNEKGKVQARLIAAFLQDYKCDLIVTSPLSRTKETASIIADCLDIRDIIEMEEFIERDYGSASGLTPEEMKDNFPNGDVLGLENQDSVISVSYQKRGVGVPAVHRSCAPAISVYTSTKV